MSNLPFEIDYVFPFVDNRDKAWQSQYIKCSKEHNRDVDVNSRRYFNHNLLKYLLRGIDKYMPWIHNVFIIVERESQIPFWLDKNKVKIIYHRDILPKELLPTYNSCTIEMFLHNIPDLSEYFIYGNDDMFPVGPMEKSDFFDENGLPKVRMEKMKYPIPGRGYLHHIKFNERLVNKDLNIEGDPNYTYLWNHSLSPMRKSTLNYLREKYNDEIYEKCTTFRSGKNYDQSLYNIWNYLSGNYSPNYKIKSGYFNLNVTQMEIIKKLIRKYQIVSLNDTHTSYDELDYLVNECNLMFESLLPDKCSYENNKTMRFDIKIVGVHQRDNWINSLKEKLNLSDDDVIYDDRPNGGKAIYTVEKAWYEPIPEGVTHRLVIQDDVIVCDDFITIVNKMINTHPDAVFALFPNAYRKYEKLNVFKELNTPYIRGKGFSGNAILMPVKYIDPCFKSIHSVYGDKFFNQIEDQCMHKWIREHDISVINTCPAIVQHIGDDSILTPGREIRRTSWFRENINESVNWNNAFVKQLNPILENSYTELKEILDIEELVNHYDENEPIPKVIHYCWFGDKEMDDLSKKCIESWKKFLPDYEIKLWNESNFDVNKFIYTKKAYEDKKYVLVSDFARFWIIFHYGGIYLDTDVELIKSIDDIIEKGNFFARENTKEIGDEHIINPGLGFGSQKYNPDIMNILSKFLLSDTPDKKYALYEPTKMFNLLGMKDIDRVQRVSYFNIYPPKYFCPLTYIGRKVDIAEETRSIHWFNSWLKSTKNS